MSRGTSGSAGEGEHPAKALTPRRGTRFATPSLDIVIRVELLGNKSRHVATLWDISTRGVCVRLVEKLPLEEPLKIRIHSPDDQEVIEAEGRLRWINKLGDRFYAGLQFDGTVDFAPTFLHTLMQLGRRARPAAATATDQPETDQQR